MSKIDELFKKHDLNYLSFTSPSDSHKFLSVLREYAEYYAKKSLTVACENAVIKTIGSQLDDIWIAVDTDTILNIELPPHD